MMQLRTNKILFLSSLLALVACSDEQELAQPTQQDGEKTPLKVTALLDVDMSASQTRAADKDFAGGDELVAYLRHVTWGGPDAPDQTRTLVTIDKSPLLVTFTKGTTPMIAYSGEDIIPIGTGVALGLYSGNTNETSDLVPDPLVYWDDFSDSSFPDTDLRTDGHYMQSYYGYCYNGGTPSANLEKETGILGWTVKTDQSVWNEENNEYANFKNSDLLWSAEQTPVGYAHKDSNTDATRRGLILPFTHAMSKVTINVTAGDGYEDDFDFDGTKLTLKDVRTTCTAAAPTATLDYSTSVVNDVTMMPGSKSGKTKTFQAIIVPSVLSLQNTLATITDMEGNNYVIPVTPAIFEGWKTQLDDVEENVHHGMAQAPTRAEIPKGVGHQMRSGVNYVLNVTVHKTKITVSATILDWNHVYAEGEGKIVFDADVETSVLSSTEHLHDITAGSFDLWRAKATTGLTGSPTSIYSLTDGKWMGDPTLYWMDDDPIYFRALAKPTNVDATKIVSVSGETAVKQGDDLLWGTTADHTGDNATQTHYAEGAAIDPRSGKVPLIFKHAMSKVSIELKTITGEGGVDLTGASIKFINLYDKGTIDVADGLIKGMQQETAPANPLYPVNLERPVDYSHELNDLLFIPQSLVNFADGSDRDQMATFYSSADLAKIYSDGTSMDDGGKYKTYLISDLNSVPAVKFMDTDEDKAAILEHNASLSGHKTAGDTKSVYTVEEAEEHNEALDGFVKPNDMNYIKEPGRYFYNSDEYNTYYGKQLSDDEYNNLSDEDKVKPVVLYTEQEAKEHNEQLPGYVNAGEAKERYDDDSAADYNATLPGAWHVGDVKVPAHYELKDSSNPPAEHYSGELREPGNKILLFVTLANGMLYKAELKDFRLADGSSVTTWEPGKHYHYTITLAKDQILFRAYIREWDEIEASGMITPEW